MLPPLRLLCLLLASVVGSLALAAPAGAHIGFVVHIGPPAIPSYVQPPCPQQNYIWSPGYWAYDPADGYYWVPGTWVPAPSPGLLWTPGYWGWNGNGYGWNPGYWAASVGFYGGVNYGYGYYGNGYAGGSWRGRYFQYNSAVTRVDRSHVHDVYSNPRVVVHGWNRVSYNGGHGGIGARPTSRDLQVARGHRVGATSVQVAHATYAAHDRANFATVNHGRPAVAAVARPYTTAHRPAASTAQVHRAVAAPQAHRAAAAPAAHHAPAAPEAHRAAPEAHHAAAAPAPHQAAPPVHHAAPAAQPHYAAPAAQPHYAAPAAQPHYAAPAAQPHYAAPQAPHAAPAMQPHAAPPQAHAAPQQRDEHGGR